jgi:hypothetical protein
VTGISVILTFWAGILYAWEELIAAAKADPTLAHITSFRYDLVDVVRQALQNLFASTYKDLQAKCLAQYVDEGGGSVSPASETAGKYTEYPRANCDGMCLPPNFAHEPK